MSRYGSWAVKAVLGLAFAFLMWWLGTHLAAQEVGMSSDLTHATEFCWDDTGSRVCVPMTIIKSTFKGYEAGSPSPLSGLRQTLINIQAQLASTLKDFRVCEGNLGPLQADLHQRMLQQQQQQLDVDNQKAAPDGQMWDTKSQKYVKMPPAPKDTK